MGPGTALLVGGGGLTTAAGCFDTLHVQGNGVHISHQRIHTLARKLSTVSGTCTSTTAQTARISGSNVYMRCRFRDSQGRAFDEQSAVRPHVAVGTDTHVL